MKTITIHGVDDYLAKLIKRKSESEGLSVNKMMKKIVEEYFNVKVPNPSKQNDFSDLCGVWSNEDYQEFLDNTQDLRVIDEEDWK